MEKGYDFNVNTTTTVLSPTLAFFYCYYWIKPQGQSNCCVAVVSRRSLNSHSVHFYRELSLELPFFGKPKKVHTFHFTFTTNTVPGKIVRVYRLSMPFFIITLFWLIDALSRRNGAKRKHVNIDAAPAAAAAWNSERHARCQCRLLRSQRKPEPSG